MSFGIPQFYLTGDGAFWKEVFWSGAFDTTIGIFPLSGTQVTTIEAKSYVVEHQMPAREGGITERLGSSNVFIKTQGFYASGDVFKDRMNSLLQTAQFFSIPSSEATHPFISGTVYIRAFKTGPVAGYRYPYYTYSLEMVQLS